MTQNLSSQSDVKLGVLSAIGAYVLWGGLPLYLLTITAIAAQEVLVARILFSVPFGALIISLRHQWPDVAKGLRNPKVLRVLALAAVCIATNWLIYIIAVQNAKIFQASLGYYINPLIYVLVGVAVLGERLRAGQVVAVILAAIGVTVLTISGGQFPFVALTLAITFTAYGYIRKRTDIGAMPGLFIETLLLSPIALMYLVYLIGATDTTIEAASPALLALLTLAGPVTVVPLVLFAIGARRLTLATVGFLQFIGPTLQFIIGLLTGEAFTTGHMICFAFIWVAVGVFAIDAWRVQRPKKPVVAYGKGPADEPV